MEQATTTTTAADILQQYIAVKSELSDGDLLQPMSGHIVDTADNCDERGDDHSYVDFHQIFAENGCGSETDQMNYLTSNSSEHDAIACIRRSRQQQSSFNNNVDNGPSQHPSKKSSSTEVHNSTQPNANNKGIACPECGKLFGRVSHMRRHQLVHSGNKPFQCDVCGDSFTRVENRDRHMIVHTKQRPYNCECGKGFTQLNRLKVHRLKHSGERPFTCALCSKRFLRVDHLRVHMRTHQVNVDTESERPVATIEQSQQQPVKTEETTERLQYLPNVEPNLPSIVVYQKRPSISDESAQQPLATNDSTSATEKSTKKLFQCNECPKRFARRDHFQRHIDVHSGARPFQCELCPKTFSRKDNKYSHMVGCLLKNYGILVETGGHGAGAVQRGQLQRTVDERVCDVLGHAYMEPVTQLQEYGEADDIDESEQQPSGQLENDEDDDADGEVNDDNIGYGDDGDIDADQHRSATEPVQPPLGKLKLRNLNELAIEPLLLPSQQQEQANDVYGVTMKNQCLGDVVIETDPIEDSNIIKSALQPIRQFQCSTCDKHFQNKSHLVRHAALHSSNRPFRCDQCDKAFNRKEHLQRHVIVHTGIKPFRCTYCDRSFVEQNQQRRHVLEEHGTEAAAAAAASARKANKGANASTFTGVDDSAILHGDSDGVCIMDSGEAQPSAIDGLYHCDRCDRRYAVKQRLRRHYSGHTGDKTYQCDYCEQRFSRAEHKRRHMAIHTNEKRFECEFCERRFIRADHMLTHVKTHEGVLPYKCAVCAERFASAKEKMEHMRRHTGAYRCEMCLERFESFGDLSEHRRDIHLQGTGGSGTVGDGESMPEMGVGCGDEETTVMGDGMGDSANSSVDMMATMDGCDGVGVDEILVGRHEQYPCPVCKRYFGIGRLGDHLNVHIANDDDDALAATIRGQRGQRMYADGMEVGRMAIGGRAFDRDCDEFVGGVIDEEALQEEEGHCQRQPQQQQERRTAWTNGTDHHLCDYNRTSTSLLWSAMKVEDGEEKLVCDADTMLGASVQHS